MSMYTKTGRRIADESQLLSEERWIIEAIKKIRTQRNGLQIERLQLESMLSSQKIGQSKENTVDTDKIVSENLAEIHQPSLLQNMQSSRDMTNSLSASTAEPLEEQCNVEALDLNVTNNPMASNLMFDVDAVEENEEEEDENAEMMIDMNMFMNSDIM